MKKTILTAALAIAVSLGAGAKTADQLRVYINPGHGSWTPNDRPQCLVNHPDAYSRTNTDTLSFFESNTNLRKGFGVLEHLIQYGLKFDRTLNQTGERHQIGAARDLSNNIVMSHVKCGPYNEDNGTDNQLGDATPANYHYYNRLLSEIKAEVQSNNFDMFISIHSNAASDGSTSNYPLFLYKGYDKPTEADAVNYNMQLLSIDMCKLSWPYAYANKNSVWTAYASSMNVRGDCNFYYNSTSAANREKIDAHTYGGYLGVLPNNTPGYLVEGYFHTYQPARHRAMNFDVCALEGEAYAHGIADYFGLNKEKTGTIYGIVRDLHQKFSHKWYSPNPASDDIYLPLNGAKVVLKKGDAVVAEYTTDDNYNGAYVFTDVEPGTYTVEVTHPDYKESAVSTVEVTAAGQSFVEGLALENNDYVAPVEEAVNYPDPVKDNAAYVPADEYVFNTEYTDQEIAELAGKTVRRALLRKGMMYVLAVDEAAANAPVILVYDTKAKAVVANVSTEGTSAIAHADHLTEAMPVADIQLTADGVLLAMNRTWTTSGADQGTLQLYKWANDEKGLPAGNPEVIMEHKYAGLWYNSMAGNTFAFSGTLDEGSGYVSAPTTSAAGTMRGIQFNFVNGVNAGHNDMRYSGTKVNFLESEMAPDYRYVTTPGNDKKFYLVDQKLGLRQFDFNGYVDAGAEVMSSDDLTAMAVPGTSSFFKYAGADYLVAPVKADGKVSGVTMVNVSGNINAPKFITATNANIEAAEYKSLATLGATEVDTDPATDEITGAYVTMYLLRDNKLTKFSTRGAKQPVNKKEYAYGLSVGAPENNVYTITYSLTGDAQDAALVLSPVDDPATETVMPLTGLSKGENTFTLDAADLEDGVEYNWSIRVNSKANANADEYFADNNGTLNVRGSVIPITDPEQESFGYTVVAHGKNNGIDVYNPSGEKVQTRMHKGHALFHTGTTNQSNPFRGDEREGLAVLGSWGDGACGLVAVNPLDAGEDPFSLYAGDKQGSGAYIYNGVNLGGGLSGLTFVGKGEDTKLYTFSEDHDASVGAANNIVRYDLGSAWQIETAPTLVGFSSLLGNTNVDLISYGEGFFASQVRGKGNNSKGCPGFAYIVDGESTARFQSADIEGMVECNSGFAITKDGKTAAVGEPTRILICDVEWNEGIPAMKIRYTIPCSSSVWTTMRFDYAGNLHVYSRDCAGYHAYALMDAEPVVTTPAKAEFTLKGSSAVDNIDLDAVTDAEAPVRYYNLNGIEMPAENLTPGVYVKVQGKKAVKVVIR